MSNFSSNAQTAITAADAVAQLINPDTTSAQRASIARTFSLQTKPYKGAFRSALAKRHQFVAQINSNRIGRGRPLKMQIDPVTYELVNPEES